MRKVYLLLLMFCMTAVAHSARAARATALSGGGTSAANFCISTADNAIYSFILSQSGTTATGVLNGVTVTTAGTYAAAELTNLKLWYNTSNTLTGATLLGTLTTGLGTGAHSFTGLTQTLTSSGVTTSGIPYYFFITATASSSVVGGHTINVAAMTSSSFTMAAGTQTGSATAGGAQTFTPSVITGTLSVCAGGTTTLANASGGGTWSSGTTSVATITSGGVVSGVSAGNSIISYTLSGCRATAAVTVGAAPAAITPAATTSLCSGVATTFADATSGGTWSVTAGTGSATITSGGVLTGLTAGSVTISYTTAGCSPATKVVTVNAAPAAITGTQNVCVGSIVTFSDATGGGTWSSGTTSVATVNSGGGITGVSSGTSIITYSVSGCYVTRSVSVNNVVQPITGTASVCAPIITNIMSQDWEVGVPTSTGTPVDGWTVVSGSGNPTYFSVVSSGSNPVASPQNGSSFLMWNSFNLTSGTADLASPAFSLTGYSNPTLTFWVYRDADNYNTASYNTEGFTFYINTSADISTATTLGFVPRRAGRVISGTYLTGTSTTTTSGWYQYTCTLPGTFTGGTNYILIRANSQYGDDCYLDNMVLSNTATYTTTLAESVTGGTWASASSAIATVTSGGVVTGVSVGTTNISYSNSCSYAVKAVTVLGVPATIGGGLTPVVTGGTTTLTNSTLYGTWSSSATSVATVNATTGVVYGVAPGTTTITYATGCGSSATKVVTVTVACTGTPTPGTASVSPSAGDATTTLALSLTGYTAVAGVTFQWQKSTTGSTSGFSNISGATTAAYNYTAGITVQTWFRCVVGCSYSGLADTSTVTTATYFPPSSCTPAWIYGTGYGYGCSDYMVVATTGYPFVLTGASGSISDGTACTASGYEDRTTAGYSITLNAGNSYTATIGANIYAYTMSDQAWIDFNNNGSFEAGESIGGDASWTGVTANPVYTIPTGSGVTSGTYRMRVETEYYYHTYPNLSPCPTASGSYYYGDVRDYKVTIAALPVITAGGTTSLCQGTNVTLSNATPGGTWSSSDAGIVFVNASGVATGGGTTGTATISYTVGGIIQTYNLYNVANPTSISGATTLCVGDDVTLTEAVTGGNWSSSASAVASVTSGGVVHGASAGTVTISYATGCGTPATYALTVNQLPGSNTASATAICTGDAATISNTTVGGTWSSSDPTIASVNPSTGVVTGVDGGTASITYSMGCVSTYAVTAMTINAAPADINPLTDVDLCIGLTTTLTNSSYGGTWSSSNTAVATVGSTTGIVGGVAAGTATITYSNACGAPMTRDVIVNTPPNATITGTSPVCQYATTTYANSVAGGSWLSSDAAIATVDAATGSVGGVAGGTATITYLISGCDAVTRSVSVTPAPAAITGFTMLCTSGSTTLANAVAGGTWSSSAPSIATINSTTGLMGATTTTGITTISYANSCSPAATVVVTVSGTPAAITGTFSLCAPQSVTLFAENWENGVPTSPGSLVNGWDVTGDLPGAFSTAGSSTNPAVSTRPSGGLSNLLIFDGYNNYGTATLISPAFSMTNMVNTTVTFYVWRENATTSSSDGFTILHNTSPSVTGATTLGFVPSRRSVAISGSYISGTSTTGTNGWQLYTCTLPASATGATNYILITASGSFIRHSYMDNMVCSGTYRVGATLTDAVPGGAWTTSASGVASVNASTGAVIPVTTGNATITYTACSNYVTQPITVNPVPGTFSGTTTICQGTSTTWTNSAGSGTWSSSNSAVATVNSAGVITGVGGGTATISFSNGCGITPATQNITVTPVPATITGATSLCPGGSGTLYNTVSGGTWTSGTPSVATVNATTGAVGAVASSGSTVITYSNGCSPAATVTLSVSSTPAPIAGGTSLCAPYTTTLFTEDWEAGVPTSVGSPVDGWTVPATSANPSYFSTVTSAFDPPASPQNGSNFLMWNSFGLSSGTADLASPAFSMVGLNNATMKVWVYRDATGDYPASGGYAAEGFTFYVNTSAAVSGGTTLGFVPRAGDGAITGSYISGTSTTSSSGWLQYTFTIPASFTGATNYIVIRANSQYGNDCYLDNMTLTTSNSPLALTDATPGGSWTSLSTSVATVGSSSGIVNAVSAGTATISYTTSCGAVGTVVTVNATPAAITGTATVCPGSTTALANTASGGTWTSSNTSVATVNASTGTVYGVAGGTATISYSTGCGSAATKVVTVLSTPGAITGATSLCPSSSGTLYNTATGGTWTSSDPSVATVNSTSGVIGATASSGTTTITYANGCGSPATIAVTVSGTTAPIVGPTSVCATPSPLTVLAQDWEAGVPTVPGSPVAGWNVISGSYNTYMSTVTSGAHPSGIPPQNGSNFLNWNSFNINSGSNTIYSPSFDLSTATAGATLTFWVYRDITNYDNSSYSAEGFSFLMNTSASLSGATTLGFVPRAGSQPISGSYISGTSTTATGGWMMYTCTIPGSFSGSSNYLFITANSQFGDDCYLDNLKITKNNYTITLTDATPGGSWSSSNSAIASVGALTGVVTGLNAGNATISYTSPCGSPVTQVVSVNANPGAISGAGSICVGGTLTLTNSAAGGTWTSGNTAVATVNAATGVVTGVAAGTVSISYSNGCGTATTASVTVKSAPAAISGATSMCPSTTTNLTDAVTGGTWSSSNTSVATIGTFSGIVYATATPGTTTITYTNGCSPDVTSVIAVSSSTDTIVGVSSICAQPTPLVATSFESGVPSIQGTAVASWNYLQGTGAANNYWSSIAGTSTASPATSGTPSGGGTFVAKFGSNAITSGNSAYLVSPSFDLSGGNGGRVTMYFYRDGNLTSTYDSLAVYINTSASASGATRIGSVCRSRTLTTAYVGTAVAAGWQKLTFTIPATFSGSTNYILFKGYSAAGNNMYLDSVQIRNNSGSATFTDATSGGTWSTSNASVATVTGTGVVSAVSAGTATISYTGACGAPVTKDLTVNPVPGANTDGGTMLCIGATTTVANSLAGGTWYSSAPTIATVDVSGTVTALSAGTATISYFNGCGAAATTALTVNPLPAVASVSPSAISLCAGGGLILTAGTATGTGTLISYNWSGPGGYSSTTASNTAAYTMPGASGTGSYSVTVTYPGLGCTSNAVSTATVTGYDYPLAQNVTGGNGCSASGITVGLDGSQSGITYALVLAPSTTAQTLSGTGSAVAFTPVTTVGAYIVTGTTGPGCTTTMTGSDTIRLTPTATPGVMPSICEGITSQSIGYTPTTGSPTTYSIDWSSAANTAGFTDITDAPLGGTMGYTIPASGAIGLFTGTITVSNGYCVSAGYSTNITVYATPTMTMTDTIVPCYGYAGSIEFSGPDSTTVNYRVNGGALNHFTFSGTTYSLSTGVLTAPVTYQIVSASNPVCATTYNDTVTITPTPMMWVGGAAGHETDWNTAANWSCGFVPSATDSVTIPGTLYAPEMPASVSATVSDLDVASGTVINLNAGSSLNVVGNVHNTGTVAGNGRVILSGSSAQKIYGIGTISNLELNNSNGATIQPGARTMISSTLYLTAGTLTTNDSLELLSTDTFATARIAEIPATGASVSGRVKTDQYVQGGYRRWRFWGHCFSDTIALIQLQPYIDITGPGGSARGFTTTTTNSPSAYWHNPYGSADDSTGYDPGWRAFNDIRTTAADTNKLHPGQGIRLFFRGSKGEGLGYLGYYGMYTPSASISKMIGHVNQGAVSVYLKRGTASQTLNQLSNPYPSPVDLGTAAYYARQAGQITGYAFYVWNPAIGAGGQYMPIPIGTSAPEPFYLPANTAYQVRAAYDGAHLDFQESYKSADRTINLFRAPANAVRFNIYDSNYHIWDVLSLQFNDKASDAEDKLLDAIKPAGLDFNFYSIAADGRRLAVDARPYEGDKVIPLGLNSSFQQDFVIRAESISVPAGGAVTLHDKLLNKYVDMKEGTEYRFTIGKDRATQGNERFELVLKPATATTAKALEVSMAPNPASDDVKITFTSGSKDNVSVRIMDVSGVSIYSQDLGTKQNGVITVPMSNFAAGVYMVELTQGDNKVTKRLVKE